MARKAVLSGGKRDEMIDAAVRLFFEHGYEATSVRMILDAVNGEVGMFYHYFKSKDELFQVAVERFFENYGARFTHMADECGTMEQFTERLLTLYDSGLTDFQRISGNMHWTIQCALVVKTIMELKPAVAKLIMRLGCKGQGRESADILASQLLLAVSGTLHSPDFAAYAMDEKRQMLTELINRLSRE